MREELKDKIPQWYKEINKPHSLVLSDDIDSLVACSVLNYVTPYWNVEFYYDFKRLFYLVPELDLWNGNDNYITSDKIWVDIAILNNEKSFDNHVILNNNWNSINPNNIAPWAAEGDCYKYKYAGSTALTVWSTYNLPLPSTEKGKMLLLTIDSSYLGFYNKTFSQMCKYYIGDILGLYELVNVMKRHSISEFDSLQKWYNTSSRTKLVVSNDNKLLVNTVYNIDEIEKLLEIPIIRLHKQELRKIREFDEKVRELDLIGFSTMMHSQIDSNIFTASLTYKGNMIYSKEKEIVA